MIIDNLTAFVTIWAVATTVIIVTISACNGCCIAKLLGKPCKTK